MACVVNMYNPEHHHQLMAPRMSFSSDFAVEPPPPPGPARGAAADADFEFSVGSHPMMAADQLFSKGRILPLREAGHGHGRPVTLRDELRGRDDDRHGRAPPRGPSIRWKELLGLKKSHQPHKKGDAAGAGSSCDAHLDLGGSHGGTRD